MKNITTPRTVSFEEALRNLASRLTGAPASALPRTQEGVVQFMAENLPPAIDADSLAEAVINEVLARLGKLPDETADTAEDAPNAATEGVNTEQATEDTPAAQNGSEKATGATKRNKNKSTD